jgi:hypothetical protein
MSDARWGDPREFDERDAGDGAIVYDLATNGIARGLMRTRLAARGDERELVVDRDRSTSLTAKTPDAAPCAFRIVPEHDLDVPPDTLDHLHDQRLLELVDLGDSERGLTLTREGRDLLDSHSLERDGEPSQVFYAGVSRSREIDHDSNLYATFRQEEARLRDEHPDLEIRRVILEQDLKREYRSSCRSPTAVAPTATADLVATRTRSVTGRANTICRTSTTRFISPTTESSTSSMAESFTRTSSSLRRTTAAPMPPAMPRPASASTWSPLAVEVVALGPVRAAWRSSCDSRIPSQQGLRQRQHQPRVRSPRLRLDAAAA